MSFFTNWKTLFGSIIQGQNPTAGAILVATSTSDDDLVQGPGDGSLYVTLKEDITTLATAANQNLTNTALGATGAIRAGVDLCTTAVNAVTTAVNALKNPDNSAVITPSDSTSLTLRTITCVTAGNLYYKLTNDSAAVMVPMTAGQVKCANIVRVMSTGPTTGTYVGEW